MERLVSRWFFYGWAVVSVTFTTAMITAGIGGFGLSFFVIPMSEELSVSRGEFSAIFAFRLALLPVVPLLGIPVDWKYGPTNDRYRQHRRRRGVVVDIPGYTLWQFDIFYGVVFGMAMNSMSGMLVGPAVISKWFVRLRGRAMAVGTMGISAGGIAIAPLAALFLRRSPDDASMEPDGDPAPYDLQFTGLRSGKAEHSFTLKQALRTHTLWLMAAIQSVTSLCLIPVLFHQVAYVQDKGFDLKTATALATTLAFFAMIAKLP